VLLLYAWQAAALFWAEVDVILLMGVLLTLGKELVEPVLYGFVTALLTPALVCCRPCKIVLAVGVRLDAV
jgi:hypothetical protein